MQEYKRKKKKYFFCVNVWRLQWRKEGEEGQEGGRPLKGEREGERDVAGGGGRKCSMGDKVAEREEEEKVRRVGDEERRESQDEKVKKKRKREGRGKKEKQE